MILRGKMKPNMQMKKTQAMFMRWSSPVPIHLTPQLDHLHFMSIEICIYFIDLLPDSQRVLTEGSKSKDWWEGNQERISPDEDQGEEGGQWGGEGELSVSGHHHISLQG